MSHQHGSESAAGGRASSSKIDAAFGGCSRASSGTDTLVIATADHGFIDVAPEESLELPRVARLAAAASRSAASGASRTATCTIAKRLHAEGEGLARRARRRACRAASWSTKAGSAPGTPHPRFAERIGDVALVMRGRYTVKDWTPGEPRHLHIGNHGGTSEDEMMIPLIVEAA